MEESKRSLLGWTCKYCTWKNVVVSPLCTMCKLQRDNRWKCEIKGCNQINVNTSQCGSCLWWNTELLMEKPKWMRNEDDSWDCMVCTFRNEPNNIYCQTCNTGPDSMHLDNLKHPINWRKTSHTVNEAKHEESEENPKYNDATIEKFNKFKEDWYSKPSENLEYKSFLRSNQVDEPYQKISSIDFSNNFGKVNMPSRPGSEWFNCKTCCRSMFGKPDEDCSKCIMARKNY